MDLTDARRILDLGCGYGVVGIIAAKLAPQAEVILTDPNERAVTLARRKGKSQLLRTHNNGFSLS
jgi:16S rRNA (guanine1207-N2)-methyltransferase